MKIISKTKSGDGTEVYIDDMGRMISEGEVEKIAKDAAIDGDIDKISELLIAGFDPNKSEGDYTLLAIAALNNHLELATFLLRKGAHVNPSRCLVVTPLMLAASQGSIEMVRVLLEHGADVNLLTKKNTNALSHAVRAKRLDSVEELMHPQYKLDRNCTINIEALSLAAYILHSELVSSKIAAKIKVHDGIVDNNILLMSAIESRRTEFSKYLISIVANVDRFNINGVNALILAVSTGQPEIVKALISAGADLEVTDVNGRSMLCIAAMHDYIDVAKLLITANQISEAPVDENVLSGAIEDNYCSVSYLILRASTDDSLVLIYQCWMAAIDKRNYSEMKLLMIYFANSVPAIGQRHSPATITCSERYQFIKEYLKKNIDEMIEDYAVIDRLRGEVTSHLFKLPSDILNHYLRPMICRPPVRVVNTIPFEVEVCVNESEVALDAALEPSMRPRR